MLIEISVSCATLNWRRGSLVCTEQQTCTGAPAQQKLMEWLQSGIPHLRSCQSTSISKVPLDRTVVPGQAGAPLRSLPCNSWGVSNTNIRIFSSCCPTSIFLLLDKSRGERRFTLQKNPIVSGCLFPKAMHLSGNSLLRSSCLQQHRVSAAPCLPLLHLPVWGLLTGISVLTKCSGCRSNLWPAQPFWTLSPVWKHQQDWLNTDVASLQCLHSGSVLLGWPLGFCSSLNLPWCSPGSPSVLDPARELPSIGASQSWTWPLGRILAAPAHLKGMYLLLSHEHLQTQAAGRERGRTLVWAVWAVRQQLQLYK